MRIYINVIVSYKFTSVDGLEVYSLPTARLWLGTAGVRCDRSRQLCVTDRLVDAVTPNTNRCILYLTERNRSGKANEESEDTCASSTDRAVDGSVQANVSEEKSDSTNPVSESGLNHLGDCLGTEAAGCSAESERSLVTGTEDSDTTLARGEGLLQNRTGYLSSHVAGEAGCLLGNKEKGVLMEGLEKVVVERRDPQDEWVSDSESEELCSSTHSRKYLSGLGRTMSQLHHHCDNHTEPPLAASTNSLQLPPLVEYETSQSSSEDIVVESVSERLEPVPNQKTVEIVMISSGSGEDWEKEEERVSLHERDTRVDIKSRIGEDANERDIGYSSALNSTIDSTGHCHHSLSQNTTPSHTSLSPSVLTVRSSDTVKTLAHVMTGGCSRMSEEWVGEEVEEGSDEGIGMEVMGEGGDISDGGSVIVIDSDTNDEVWCDRRSGMEQSHAHVVHCCGMELSHSDLRTLSPNQYVNDQVGVNMYV